MNNILNSVFIAYAPGFIYKLFYKPETSPLLYTPTPLSPEPAICILYSHPPCEKPFTDHLMVVDVNRQPSLQLSSKSGEENGC